MQRSWLPSRQVLFYLACHLGMFGLGTFHTDTPEWFSQMLVAIGVAPSFAILAHRLALWIFDRYWPLPPPPPPTAAAIGAELVAMVRSPLPVTITLTPSGREALMRAAVRRRAPSVEEAIQQALDEYVARAGRGPRVGC